MTIPDETPDLNQPQKPTRQFYQFALAIILFGLMLQMPCLTFDKVIDDNDLIYSVEQRGCGENPADCFLHPVFLLYYRPLFTATFSLGDTVHAKASDAVNSLLNRMPIKGRVPLEAHSTIWYHLENLALHVAVCALGFWFFYLLFGRERPALLAGLFFSLHPLQVSATTFIGGRPDSMALFFLLLFLIGAWNATRKIAETEFPLRTVAWFLLSLLAFSCALFTKDQCLCLLPLLPVLYFRPGSTFSLKRLPWLTLYLPPAVSYLVLAHWVAGRKLSAVSSPHWSRGLHAEMIGRTLWYFERLLVIPAVGPIHQSTLGPWDIPQPFLAGAGYAIAILWLAALWHFRNRPAYRFCALWITLTLFPCLNLIPIPSQFASCYRAVIPLLGLAGMLGLGLDRMFVWWRGRVRQFQYATYGMISEPGISVSWKERLRTLHANQFLLGWTVILLISAFYTWETVADVPNWENNHTLMLAEIYGDPNFAPAFGGLGFWEEQQHDDKPVKWALVEQRFGKVLDGFMPTGPADQRFAIAVNSMPCQQRLWSHAGLRYEPVGYLRMILPHRGWARQEQGHFAAAAEDYRRELLVNPDDDNTRANLRTCLMANGQIDEAISLYNNANEVEPRSQNDQNGTTTHPR